MPRLFRAPHIPPWILLSMALDPTGFCFDGRLGELVLVGVWIYGLGFRV